MGTTIPDFCLTFPPIFVRTTVKPITTKSTTYITGR